MSLQEQLSTLKAQNIASLPKEKIDVLLDETEMLGKSGIVEAAPVTGDTLKDFTLPNHLDEKRSLAALRELGACRRDILQGRMVPLLQPGVARLPGGSAGDQDRGSHPGRHHAGTP
jgi:hypothetical protein